jgi:hypothetical protein
MPDTITVRPCPTCGCNPADDPIWQPIIDRAADYTPPAGDLDEELAGPALLPPATVITPRSSIGFSDELVLDLTQIIGFTQNGYILTSSGHEIAVEGEVTRAFLTMWQQMKSGRTVVDFDLETCAFVPVGDVTQLALVETAPED